MTIKEFIRETLQNFHSVIERTYQKKIDIVDNVSSTDTDKPLSANQGKNLQDQITTNTVSIINLNSNKMNDSQKLYRFLDLSIDVGSLDASGEKYDQKFIFNIPDGYNTCAITSFGLVGSGYTKCVINKLIIKSNTLTYSIKNVMDESTQELTLKVSILCLRSINYLLQE